LSSDDEEEDDGVYISEEQEVKRSTTHMNTTRRNRYHKNTTVATHFSQEFAAQRGSTWSPVRRNYQEKDKEHRAEPYGNPSASSTTWYEVTQRRSNTRSEHYRRTLRTTIDPITDDHLDQESEGGGWSDTDGGDEEDSLQDEDPLDTIVVPQTTKSTKHKKNPHDQMASSLPSSYGVIVGSYNHDQGSSTMIRSSITDDLSSLGPGDYESETEKDDSPSVHAAWAETDSTTTSKSKSSLQLRGTMEQKTLRRELLSYMMTNDYWVSVDHVSSSDDDDDDDEPEDFEDDEDQVPQHYSRSTRRQHILLESASSDGGGGGGGPTTTTSRSGTRNKVVIVPDLASELGDGVGSSLADGSSTSSSRRILDAFENEYSVISHGTMHSKRNKGGNNSKRRMVVLGATNDEPHFEDHENGMIMTMDDLEDGGSGTGVWNHLQKELVEEPIRCRHVLVAFLFVALGICCLLFLN
jgi:hypothetical protein